MNSTCTLVRCPRCNCQVRSDRIKKHLAKAHDANHRVSQKLVDPALEEKFRRVEELVESWLKKGIYVYSRKRAKCLVAMALYRGMGFDWNEIHHACNGRINRGHYDADSHYNEPIYKAMMRSLSESLRPYARSLGERDLRAQKVLKGSKAAINSSGHGDYEVSSWKDCNNIDSMDGSKYIGYLRREYEGSRFGSYPMHDDYGDESWADGNSWE